MNPFSRALFYVGMLFMAHHSFAYPLSSILSDSQPLFVRELAKRELAWIEAITQRPGSKSQFHSRSDVSQCLNSLSQWDTSIAVQTAMPNFAYILINSQSQNPLKGVYCVVNAASMTQWPWVRSLLTKPDIISLRRQTESNYLGILWSQDNTGNIYVDSLIFKISSAGDFSRSGFRFRNKTISSTQLARLVDSNFYPQHFLELRIAKTPQILIRSFKKNLSSNVVSNQIVLDSNGQETQYIATSPFLADQLPLELRGILDKYRREFSIRPRVIIVNPDKEAHGVLLP